MDLAERSIVQATECARFKRECQSESDHITGLDWCDIDYRDYIPKYSIYDIQPQCFSLETLINSWESQLGSMQEDLPSPMWPHDPYNRHKMRISDIINYSRRYEWNNGQSQRRELPEKLDLLVTELDENADDWQNKLNLSEQQLQNALRGFYIEKGVFDPELAEDDVLGFLPILRFQVFLRNFLTSYELLYKNIVPQVTVENSRNRIQEFLYNIDQGNDEFMNIFDPLLVQIQGIAADADDYVYDYSLNIDDLVIYLINGLTPALTLTQYQTEAVTERLYEWLPVLIRAYQDDMAINNVRLILAVAREISAYHRVNYNTFYVIIKTLFRNMTLNDWDSSDAETLNYQDYVNDVVGELEDHELVNAESGNQVSLALNQIFQRFTGS